jgi:two-component system LytT family response regulator
VNVIRVLIVDDEPIARRGIRQLLTAHQDVQVAGEARDGREAVRMLKALAPDLVFLDVQMPELDGFGVLRQLDPGQVPAVIFVTAHDAYAVRAFELHALDYLVKPVHEARFQDAACSGA